MDKFALIFAISCMFSRSLQHQDEESKLHSGSYLLYLLIGDVHGVKDDITEIKHEIKEINDELYAETNATDGYKDDINELKVAVNKHSSEISQFKNDITGLDTEIERHGNKISGYRKDYIELINETTEQQNTVSELKVQMSELISDLTEVKDELAEQKDDINEINYAIMDQQETINNLTRRVVIEREDVHDCKDILDIYRNSVSGVYEITVNVDGQLEPLDVYCDMDTDGGGWTLFQKRFDGSVDFYQTFQEYENGFGSLNGEFWLGLKWVYYIAKNKHQTLRVDIVTQSGTKQYETYSTFSLGSPSLYKLHVSKGSGTAGDNFNNGDIHTHNGQAFTAKDKDSDNMPSGNCAVRKHAGYWYNYCNSSNLNGKYNVSTNKGFYWASIKHLKASELKLRPK